MYFGFLLQSSTCSFLGMEGELTHIQEFLQLSDNVGMFYPTMLLHKIWCYFINYDATLYIVYSYSHLQFLIAYNMQKQKGKAWETESCAWCQVDVRVDRRGAVTDRYNSQTLHWSASSLPNNELYWHCLLNVTVSSSWTKYYKKDLKILRQALPTPLLSTLTSTWRHTRDSFSQAFPLCFCTL